MNNNEENVTSIDLENRFLNQVSVMKSPVTIFLVNGVKLQGSITAIDNTSLLLSRNGQTQLVYRHAISTVMPETAINL